MSFFDIEGQDKQLWHKCLEFDTNPSHILLKQTFHTKKKNGKIKPRILLLTNKYLFRTKVLILNFLYIFPIFAFKFIINLHNL